MKISAIATWFGSKRTLAPVILNQGVTGLGF